MSSLKRQFFLSIFLFGKLGVAFEVPELKTDRELLPPLPTVQVAQRESQPAVPPAKKEGVGKQIQDLGEQVASRVDRIIKKNAFDLWGDPWTVQGIPIIFPSSSNGFNLGLRLALDDIDREDPYKYELDGTILASDKGRYKYFMRFDAPHAFDDQYRITARAAYDRDISFHYYGIGNETHPSDSPDSLLYSNVRESPSFTLQILRYVGRHVRLGPLLGLKWMRVTVPTGSLLAQQNPVGTSGGRTHYVGFAIVYDTLDFEPYPSRGAVHELYVNYSAPWTGSDYEFFRATYTYLRFIPLHRKLIFAHRALIESLSGNVPFYELDAVGGSNATIGLGGDRFFRGYDSNRFVDKLRFIMGFELRWDPIFFIFYKQDITVGFVPFLDIGRVWPSVFPLALGSWHASTGMGVRILWNSRFIIRGDFAINPEGSSAIINLGSSF